MANYPLCDQSLIDRREIESRKVFLGFSADDEKNLEEIHAVIHADIDRLVSDFYTHLSQFLELHRFLTDPQTLARLRQTQRHYLLSLGQHMDQLSYWEDRLHIGTSHERIKLPLKWYLGAYSRLFQLIGERLAAVHGSDPQRLASLLITLEKVFTLDATLAVETYYQATMQRLQGLLKELTAAQSRLQEMARIDALTQVLNRRSLLEALESELQRSLRFRRPFSLLFLDIDRFKQVNDRHGHVFGDFVLQKLIQSVRGVLRPADIIGRYGGEEFLIGLVEADEAVAQQTAERVRLQVARTPFELGAEQATVTISIGLASLRLEQDRLETLIQRSDQALYQAKQAGRNRVSVSPN